MRKQSQPHVGRSKLTGQWYHIVGDVVRERGGDPDLYYPMFNKNVRELRKLHRLDDGDDSVIIAGFERFAAMVAGRKIDVRGKPAWLVFWSRRNKLVRKVATATTTALPPKRERRSSLDIPRSPRRSAFER